MKAIKLKPLFFPSDDILVQPPDILSNRKELEKAANKTSSSIGQLKTILRGRRLKKNTGQKKLQSEIEKETVQNLSEWKRTASPKSPLTRKFTFKRTFTMNQMGNEPKSPLKPKTELKAFSLGKLTLIDALVSTVQGIVTNERFKKKVKDEEIKEISGRNQRYEKESQARINKLVSEIKALKGFIRESAVKLEKLKEEFAGVNKKYEEDTAKLALVEAQELLFKDKEGKKSLRTSDERQYFVKKEKIRQLKQDLHKTFQESKEKYLTAIENSQKTLEASEYQRQVSKKELKEYREQIIMLYCRTLKDGKDIRNDGLRWIIKNLWMMNEAIPMSAFPKFLDDESAHFLLVMAEKDLELVKCEKKLEMLRKDIREKRPSSALSSAKGLYDDVRKRLREISQSSIGHVKKEIYTINSVSGESRAKSNYSGNFNEISDLRQKIGKIQDFIKENMTAEIKRVTDLYQINATGSEEIGLFHIIKCLVGEKVREYNKYTRSGAISKARGSILIN